MPSGKGWKLKVIAVAAVVVYVLVVGASSVVASASNFKRSNRLYYLNRGLDRDKDGIACEKR